MSRVVVVGNAGLDLRLTVPRLPLPGETLIGSDGAWAPGGRGLNQAVVAARCGARVRFCTPLGNDEAQAREIERHLSREGFDELILPRLPCDRLFAEGGRSHSDKAGAFEALPSRNELCAIFAD